MTAPYITRPVTDKLHACFKNPKETLFDYKLRIWTLFFYFLYAILNIRPF